MSRAREAERNTSRKDEMKNGFFSILFSFILLFGAVLRGGEVERKGKEGNDRLKLNILL